MEDHNDFFKELETPEPPAHLARDIVVAIHERRRRKLYLNIIASASGFVASFLVTILGTMSFSTELSHSGFFGFSSLLISDFSATIANFPDFMTSLAESFPAISAAIVIAGIAFAIWSVAALLDETATLRHA